MAYRTYKWKPSKSAIREFANKMNEVEEFCNLNGINHSASMDSFYFNVNGKEYRVSNHSIESSNRAAFDDFGNQVRELYHEKKRSDEVIYIHASKTRIIEIYNDLVNGFVLDGKGKRKIK